MAIYLHPPLYIAVEVFKCTFVKVLFCNQNTLTITREILAKT